MYDIYDVNYLSISTTVSIFTLQNKVSVYQLVLPSPLSLVSRTKGQDLFYFVSARIRTYEQFRTLLLQIIALVTR